MITLTDSNFKEFVDTSKLPVIIDFWAEWCSPCKQIAPILEELDTEYKESIQIAKIDIDHNNETPVQYDVRSIPTLLFFKNGENLGRTVGAVSKQLIIDKLEHLQLL